MFVTTTLTTILFFFFPKYLIRISPILTCLYLLPLYHQERRVPPLLIYPLIRSFEKSKKVSPYLFSRMNKPSSLSFPWTFHAPVLNQLSSLLLDSVIHVHTPLYSTKEAQKWTEKSRCITLMSKRGEGPSWSSCQPISLTSFYHLSRSLQIQSSTPSQWSQWTVFSPVLSLEGSHYYLTTSRILYSDHSSDSSQFSTNVIHFDITELVRH